MACAHAKFSGDVGVCLATSGPGAIHLLNGLYDAKLDHQPVVAIVGQQATMSLGASYQQEVDLVSLFKDVASEYVQVATAPAQVTHLIDRAVQIARATPLGDLRDRPQRRPGGADSSRRRARTARSSRAGRCRSRGCCPHDAELGARRRGPQRRRAGRDPRRPGRARGGGARSSSSPSVLGAGVAKALNGRDVLPDDLPYVTGLDRPARHQAERRDDAGLRHAADGRLRLPVRRVAARAGPGARRADRPRRAHARHPLPDGGQPRRRRARHAAGAAARCSSARPTACWREELAGEVERWWRAARATRPSVAGRRRSTR